MDTLEQLHMEIRKCKKCLLHISRTNAVPGDGPKDAKLMFVGEAPGAKEDETGSPFVGRSGKLLTEMIEGIGFKRDEVFITSILKSRPPNNRAPKSDEKKKCLPYLEKQIEIIGPKVIVLLGRVAIFTLIGPWKLDEAHGRFYEGSGHTYFMTYHPAAALRFPKLKDVMKQDFIILKNHLS